MHKEKKTDYTKNWYKIKKGEQGCERKSILYFFKIVLGIYYSEAFFGCCLEMIVAFVQEGHFEAMRPMN